MSLRDRADDAYDWFAALSLSARIWLIMLVGGLAVIPLTRGASSACSWPAFSPG